MGLISDKINKEVSQIEIPPVVVTFDEENWRKTVIVLVVALLILIVLSLVFWKLMKSL